jgi:hypothetical protein
VGTFQAGVNPFGLAFDGSSMWVANAGPSFDFGADSVTRLRASDGANLGTFPAGDNPHSILFDGANIWVGNRGFGVSSGPPIVWSGSLCKL